MFLLVHVKRAKLASPALLDKAFFLMKEVIGDNGVFAKSKMTKQEQWDAIAARIESHLNLKVTGDGVRKHVIELEKRYRTMVLKKERMSGTSTTSTRWCDHLIFTDTVLDTGLEPKKTKDEIEQDTLVADYIDLKCAEDAKHTF